MEHHQLFDGDHVMTIPPLKPVVRFSSQPPSPWWLDLDVDIDFDTHEPPSAPAANNKATSSAGSGSVGSGSHKKLHHNAYERDRRKQFNDLYSLRSLLPDADHTKKLSLLTTVCQVLEYIPKLKKEVESLEKKKEELTRAKCTKDGINPIVSATPLDDNEILVQMSLFSNMAESPPLSKCIEVLENEGFRLISSSNFPSFDNSRTFHTLQLKISEGAMSKECPTLLCDKLQKAVKEKASHYVQ